MQRNQNDNKKPHVLILGGGFVGYYCARELERFPELLEVTLISEINYFLFTPLLHEVASAELGLSDVVAPMRELLQATHFRQGYVRNIDLENRTVTVSYGDSGTHVDSVAFDELIIALGSETNMPLLEAAASNAVMGMKTLGDAIALRNRMIGNLETTEHELETQNDTTRLTFVVAGGGFAGVETAGAINDFVRNTTKYYPSISKANVRVCLVHSKKYLLNELSQELGEYACHHLRARGVEVLTERKVKAFDGRVAVLNDGTSIHTDTLIWTAGTRVPKIVRDLNLPQQHGKILADQFLRVPGHDHLWAAGDCALIPINTAESFAPPTAQHAVREGKLLARNIVATLTGSELAPFTYKTKGQMASIGSRAGVAKVFGVQIHGFVAWLLWRSFYWTQLPSWSRKVRVAFNWFMDLFLPPDLVQVDTAPYEPAVYRRSSAAQPLKRSA
jgi:NADH dehydrogenase